MNTARVTPESSRSYLDPRGFLGKMSRQNLRSTSRKVMVGPEVTATRNKEKLALVAPLYAKASSASERRGRAGLGSHPAADARNHGLALPQGHGLR